MASATAWCGSAYGHRDAALEDGSVSAGCRSSTEVDRP
jgi:hypothetical protein